MNRSDLHIVTGAFGYSGQYIARRLLERGVEVRTLTHSPLRENPFGGRVKAQPFHFDDPAKMTEALRGARVLYNTYWVRFNSGAFTFEQAIENSRRLFTAAARAGIERIVHLSITNPAEDSSLGYFRGKATVERMLRESGISYAILRPTVLFGQEDILINNIAWLLRRLPVFGVFGDGRYRLQPIYVDDLAQIAVEQGFGKENCTLDTIGPETFSYRELVGMIGQAIGHPRPILSVPDSIGYLAGWALGRWLGDVVITREEIEGLKRGLLCVNAPPLGRVKLSEWAGEHAADLGRRYAAELARRRDRVKSYDQL